MKYGEAVLPKGVIGIASFCKNLISPAGIFLGNRQLYYYKIQLSKVRHAGCKISEHVGATWALVSLSTSAVPAWVKLHAGEMHWR